MVYFGNKQFKGTLKGMSAGDKKLLIRPLIVVVGCLMLYWLIWEAGSSQAPPATDLPVDVVTRLEPNQPGNGSDPGLIKDGLEPEVGEVLDVAPAVSRNREPDEFVDNPLLLFSVTDEGESSKRDDLGRIYLFHRWRAGVEVPIESEPLPPKNLLREMAPELRGKRYSLYVTSRIEPWTRELEDNPSGVREYWEGWAHSKDYLFRILFVEKPAQLMKRDSDWQVEADFLRVHRWRDKAGRLHAVPEMVAKTLTPFDGRLDFGHSSYLPLWITLGVAIVGMAVGVWLVNRWQKKPRLLSEAMARSGAGRSARRQDANP